MKVRKQPVVATAVPAALAECPIWDADRDLLWWVDLLRGDVLCGRIAGDRIDATVAASLGGFASFVALGTDGSVIVGSGRDIVRLDGSGAQLDRGAVVPDGIGSRLNDGAIDPSGRLVVGTLALDDRLGQEALLRLEHDGRVTILDDDLHLSNGLGWSPDGRRLYTVDSLRRVVFFRDYDPHGDEVGERRVLIEVPDAYPDGMCVDTQGRLWVAMWMGGDVRCFSPDGEELGRVALPVTLVASCGFAGPVLDRLVIATARAAQLEDADGAPDLAGHLFLAEVSAVGQPPSLWRPRALSER